mmetsp:Transcript_111865/g.280232  ORF Transcript_111865/g.280232 Transcript_111865/m.280232 type:complete len:93 (+) Transcript_111865:73-351(+)
MARGQGSIVRTLMLAAVAAAVWLLSSSPSEAFTPFSVAASSTRTALHAEAPAKKAKKAKKVKYPVTVKFDLVNYANVNTNGFALWEVEEVRD